MSGISLIKNMTTSFLKGMAFGIGFLLVIVVIFFLFGRNLSLSTPQKKVEITAEQFIISDTNILRTSPTEMDKKFGSSSTISFTGTIENKGKATEKYLNVYADMYDENETFIYQCFTQFSDGLKQNEKRNFLIQCHNLPEEVAEKYASFKIYTRNI
jgi:ABC-type transport system involved in multi-copper enzyme maturation permease subunit